MTTPEFSKSEYAMLREAANMAMGTAGAALADLVSVFVKLSVPAVKIVAPEQMGALLPGAGGYGSGAKLTAVRQSFHGDVSGEAFVIFDETTPESVSRLLGLDETTSRPEQLDLLVEVSSTLIGRCVKGISRQLFSREASLDAPAVLAEKVDGEGLAKSVLASSQLGSGAALSLKIQFGLEDEPLKSDLLIFIPPPSIEPVRTALDAMLAKIPRRPAS